MGFLARRRPLFAHKFLRRTDSFICAMDAAQPAAGTALTFNKFSDGAPHMVLARISAFYCCYPADPFVAS